MSGAFGFSVGDLIAGLRLIYVSCGAVRNASSAQSEYASLTSEVQSLVGALEAIDDLQLEHRGTEKQWSALRSAILSCKTCTDDFLAKIAKYQPHLQEGAKGGWIAGYRKIKWAICKKEDIATFRAQLERRTSSVNMLLITFQAKERLGSGSRNTTGLESSTALAVPTPENDRTAQLLQGLTLEQRQLFQVLISQNEQLQQSLDDIRGILHMQASIPPQVFLQKPVLLLDAFGKVAPFHLDFIDSLDAFVAVLKIRSQHAGVQHSGIRKIDNREFYIRDTNRRRKIDVTRPWTSVFRPGQNVDMSMVFRRRLTPSICPECGSQSDCHEEDEDQEIECDVCGLWYHRTLEEEQSQSFPYNTAYSPSMGSSCDQQSCSDYSDDQDDPDFGGYRRIRIISIVNTQQLEIDAQKPDMGYIQQNSPQWVHDGQYPAFLGAPTPRPTPQAQKSNHRTTIPRNSHNSRPLSEHRTIPPTSPRKNVRSFLRENTLICIGCNGRFLKWASSHSDNSLCDSCQRSADILGLAPPDGSARRAAGKGKQYAVPSECNSVSDALPMSGISFKLRPERPKSGARARSGKSGFASHEVDRVKDQMQWTLMDARL